MRRVSEEKLEATTIFVTKFCFVSIETFRFKVFATTFSTEFPAYQRVALHQVSVANKRYNF